MAQPEPRSLGDRGGAEAVLLKHAAVDCAPKLAWPHIALAGLRCCIREYRLSLHGCENPQEQVRPPVRSGDFRFDIAQVTEIAPRWSFWGKPPIPA